MGRGARRKIGRLIVGLIIIAGGFPLAGCFDYQNSEFTTNQDVALRAGQADDARVTATVPRGTPVERLGWVGGECECWLVATPNGVGWVYTRYLELHLADVAP
jgi:hypothetical protein